jgi:hypothetical protein
MTPSRSPIDDRTRLRSRLSAAASSPHTRALFQHRQRIMLVRTTGYGCFFDLTKHVRDWHWRDESEGESNESDKWDNRSVT